MKLALANGITSLVLRVKVPNTDSDDPNAGKTGLTFESAGLIISTIADNEAAPTVYTVAAGNVETIATLGTFAAPTAGKCRFKAVDATNHPGLYEVQIANARWAVSGARSVVVTVAGAANAGQVDAEIQQLPVPSDQRQILGTAPTEGAAGRLAAALTKFGDVATPALTAECVNQTADVGEGVDVATLPATPPDGYGPDTNASHFTGAFPASTLVNAPRTGMSIADESCVLGPMAATTDQVVGHEDIGVRVFKNGSPRFCARVFLNGADVRQADLTSIVYSVYLLDENDSDFRAAVTGHSAVSLAPSEVIFDVLQSDAQASDYNFCHQIPVSVNNAFAIAGKKYLVEYTLTPVAGERVLVRFRVNVI